MDAPTLTWIDPLVDRPGLDAWVEVHRASDRDVHGESAVPWTADELVAFSAPSTTRRFQYLLATLGEEPVGAGRVAFSLKDNLELAVVICQVHPDHCRRGTGSRLLAALEARAVEGGRSICLASTEWPLGAEDDRGAFAARHGYAEAQTVLRSSLSLPVEPDRLVRLRDGEGRADAVDYVVETVWDGVPDEWLKDRAELGRRMSTDIPTGGMALEEEHWDAERVREVESRIRRGGRQFVESYARHVDSGRLVGYTTYEVPTDDRGLAFQGDTLVLREHRGHGLGARLKAANTLALQQQQPDVTAVRTWNAQENEPMLRVNRAMGFAVDAYEREWQKRL